MYEDEFWRLYERPTAYPRAWLVHRVAVCDSAETALAEMKSPEFDGHTIAIVDHPLPEPLDVPEPDSVETATIVTCNPGEIVVRVRAKGRAMLVLSEIFYPGWRVAIDGKAVESYPVNYALRGVVVPAGDSSVALTYAPTSIRVGATITSLAWLVGIAFAMSPLFWRVKGEVVAK